MRGRPHQHAAFSRAELPRERRMFWIDAQMIGKMLPASSKVCRG